MRLSHKRKLAHKRGMYRFCSNHCHVHGIDHNLIVNFEVLPNAFELAFSVINGFMAKIKKCFKSSL